MQVWRSGHACARLRPSLATRLLQTRCGLKLQRWFRKWLVRERLRMLELIRARVAATTTNRLYLPTALFESLRGPEPLHVGAPCCSSALTRGAPNVRVSCTAVVHRNGILIAGRAL